MKDAATSQNGPLCWQAKRRLFATVMMQLPNKLLCDSSDLITVAFLGD